VNVKELLEEAEKIEKEIESLIKASRPVEREKDSDKGMFV
jgi:predicted ATP-grasp superfamily ATP-dependent carboligase